MKLVTILLVYEEVRIPSMYCILCFLNSAVMPAVDIEEIANYGSHLKDV
jgi:hypothetical protein